MLYSSGDLDCLKLEYVSGWLLGLGVSKATLSIYGRRTKSIKESFEANCHAHFLRHRGDC